MPFEEAAVLDDAAADLAAQGDVDWFVDANTILSGTAARILADRTEVFSVPEVVAEVRRRPRSRDANLFADRLTVRTSSSFGGAGDAATFVLDCACRLAPSVRVRARQLVEAEDLDDADAEKKAIEMLANEGRFFECELVEAAEKALDDPSGRHAREKQLRRPWFRYPAKRRSRGTSHPFSDETLVGVVLCNALINNRATIVLSDDRDLTAIMKQFADNVLWVASAVDCELTLGKAELDTVTDFWERRCNDLNRFRQARTAQRFVEAFECPGSTSGAGRVFAPTDGEVLIWRSDGPPLMYPFPKQFVTFVRSYK
jgi:hypothetical protein